MEYLLYRPIDPRVVVVAAAVTASAHDNHRNENVFLGNNVATRSKTKRLAGCVYAANGKGAVGGQTMGGGRRWQLLFEYSPMIVCVSMVLLVSTRLRCRDCGCRMLDMDDDGEESEVVRFNFFESSSYQEGEPSSTVASSSPISNDAIAAETPPPSKSFR
jgi:hypothetical protein